MFLAVLFRSCCWGFFCVWCGSFGVLSLILYQSANLHFLLCCLCCFCCLLTPVCSVVFFCCCPPWPYVLEFAPPWSLVYLHTQSLPPLCTILPLYVPNNPCVSICALLGRVHVVMTVLVSVCVFVCLLPVLCVCAYLCLGLLVSLCMCFVFAYVSVVVLCAQVCVWTYISRLHVCVCMCVFSSK